MHATFGRQSAIFSRIKRRRGTILLCFVVRYAQLRLTFARLRSSSILRMHRHVLFALFILAKDMCISRLRFRCSSPLLRLSNQFRSRYGMTKRNKSTKKHKNNVDHVSGSRSGTLIATNRFYSLLSFSEARVCIRFWSTGADNELKSYRDFVA